MDSKATRARFCFYAVGIPTWLLIGLASNLALFGYQTKLGPQEIRSLAWRLESFVFVVAFVAPVASYVAYLVSTAALRKASAVGRVVQDRFGTLDLAEGLPTLYSACVCLIIGALLATYFGAHYIDPVIKTFTGWRWIVRLLWGSVSGWIAGMVIGNYAMRLFWWLGASRDSRSFPLGPSGPVPLSSGELNAELIRAASKQLGASEAAEVKAILNSVAREQYSEALDAIDRMLQVQRQPDARTLLLWAKSNVYQRTRKLAEEIDVLTQLSALRPHPLFELNLGIANGRLENYQEAEAHYLQAIRVMNGRYHLAVYNLGIMYCDKGARGEATRQLRASEGFGKDVPGRLVDKLKRRISGYGH